MMNPNGWNSRQAILKDGKRRTEFHCKWINFLKDTWEPIDLEPQEDSTSLKIERAPYNLYLPKSSAGEIRFEATNCYSVRERKRKDDAPLGKTKQFQGIEDVPGEVTRDGVLYRGAFPSLNADLLIQPHEQEVRYLVKFNGPPPGREPFVQIPFVQEADGGVRPLERLRNREVGTKNADYEGMQYVVSDFRGITTKQAFVWDSNPEGSLRIPVKIRGRMRGGVFHGAKMIPRSFFENAVYPVFTDTTDTFYPDANPETTTVDGFVYRSVGGESWATITTSAGTGASDSSSPAWSTLIRGNRTNNWKILGRSIFLFDTTGIGTVTSATLSLYGQFKADGAGIAPDLNIYGATTSSNTALSSADYANTGSTPFSSAISYASFVIAYNDFSLNASGIANIVDGVSKFSGRNANYDVAGIEPSNIALTTSQMDVYTSEQSGTSYDPKLVVEHGAAATGGTSDFLQLF